MNIEVGAKFVAALRSGKYKKTVLQLRDAGGCFCVMGVLCDLYQQEFPDRMGWAVKEDALGIVGYSFGDVTMSGIRKDGFTSQAPKRVLEWAGLTTYNARELVELNDIRDLSFPEIADRIEHTHYFTKIV